MTEPGTLVDLCETLRGLLEIERSLAVITGHAARSAPDPQAAVLLAAFSSHHAWRAEQLETRWPAVDAVGAPPPLTAPTGDAPDAQQLLSALAHEVLPGLLTTYGEALSRLDAQLDAPSVRLFAIARADVEADLLSARSGLSEGSNAP